MYGLRCRATQAMRSVVPTKLAYRGADIAAMLRRLGFGPSGVVSLMKLRKERNKSREASGPFVTSAGEGMTEEG